MESWNLIGWALLIGLALSSAAILAFVLWTMGAAAVRRFSRDRRHYTLWEETRQTSPAAGQTWRHASGKRMTIRYADPSAVGIELHGYPTIETVISREGWQTFIDDNLYALERP
jgi:hypothetical protein